MYIPASNPWVEYPNRVVCPQGGLRFQFPPLLTAKALGSVQGVDILAFSTKSPHESVEKGIELVQKALTLDDTLAEAHGFLGYLYTQKREYEKGIAQGERAEALNPGDSTVLVNYATSLNFAGRSEEAITLLQKAIRLNPHGPTFYYHNFGNALFMTGRNEEAVSAYKKVIQRAPDDFYGHLILAAIYSKMGRFSSLGGTHCLIQTL